MKLKVCGMRNRENVYGIGRLEPDFMGFIIYPKSKRFVGDDFDIGIIRSLPDSIKKVGVFVKEEPSVVLKKVKQYNLDYAQLHGGESIEDCLFLKQNEIKVIKVFSIQDSLPIEEIDEFSGTVDYFLFDTKTSGYGGSGEKFDWSILRDYSGDIPYFLSGGIDLDDIDTIQQLKLSKLFCIDVNSRFELEPGLKDIGRVKELSDKLHPPVSPLKGGVDPDKSIAIGSKSNSKKNKSFSEVLTNSPLEGGKRGVKRYRNKIIPYKPYLQQKARELRKDSTTSEVLLWLELRNRQMLNYQFHRQVPMLDFIVDFYCHELMLAIEVDGESHQDKVEGDKIRQKRLENEGVNFLRFDDLDVKKKMGFVSNSIHDWIKENEGDG